MSISRLDMPRRDAKVFHLFTASVTSLIICLVFSLPIMYSFEELSSSFWSERLVWKFPCYRPGTAQLLKQNRNYCTAVVL